jgi:hypothetical protein
MYSSTIHILHCSAGLKCWNNEKVIKAIKTVEAIEVIDAKNFYTTTTTIKTTTTIPHGFSIRPIIDSFIRKLHLKPLQP